MSLLEQLRRDGHLRPLDHAFALSLRRLDPATPDNVLAAAALASLAVSAGHAGFDPAQPRALVDAAIDWPAPDDWRAALQASRWISQPPAGDDPAPTDAPLVFEGDDVGGLLYLRRYREYERRLANGLRRIGSHPPDASDIAALAPLFAQLFNSAPISTLPPQAGEGTHAGDERPSSLASGNENESAAAAITRDDGGAEPSPAAASKPFPRERGKGGDGGAPDGQPATLPRPDHHQARAAALALRHNLALVTGGPGTGKTTTIARLLVLLAAQATLANRPVPRIALAAPTGRAAERMAESLRKAAQPLEASGIDAALLAPLATSGSTLHRLLGTIPDMPTFRHHADNPLEVDIVVVDEASMIDLPLMAKLVEAVPDGAKLILLGDPDQLPSVEAGDVLSGILAAAGDGLQLRQGDADALRPLLGPPRHDDAAPADTHARFPACHAHLVRGWRQSAALDLAPLANAVRQGDANTTLDLLRDGALDGVHWHPAATDPLQHPAQRERFLAHWTALANAATPAQALAQAGALRILTAVRDGPQGARTLNARIEALLTTRLAATPQRRPAHAARDQGGFFHGRLLLITENSYRHRLFNGDIGICLRSEAGPGGDDEQLMAWFPGDTPDQPRAFHPATLPAHDSAFAMTVHKAQGSEFDAVWLLLPGNDNRVLSRELVYTGITRAKTELHLAASEDILAKALHRHAVRWSGLGWRLGLPS